MVNMTMRCLGCLSQLAERRRASKLKDEKVDPELVESAEDVMHRESLRGFFAFIALQVIYLIFYVIYSSAHGSKWNLVPVASSSMSMLLNAISYGLLRLTKSKHVFQASQMIVLSFDAVLGALNNPCVQWAWWDHLSFYSYLGDIPGCSIPVNWLANRVCTVSEDCTISVVLVQGRMMFEILFILRFCYARVGLCTAVIVYCTVLEVSGRILTLSTVCVLFLVIQNLVMLVAKWRMESFQWQVCLQLAQKEKQITCEKVLRCQAEFRQEALYDFGQIRIDADMASLESGFTSEVTGSSTIFGRWNEPGSDVTVKLERLHALAAKERWLIDRSDCVLQADRICGAGSFGIVVAGTVHGAPVAVKFVRNIPNVAFGPAGKKLRGVPELATELRILRQTRHPNVVLLYGVCVDLNSRTFALVSEFIEGPDLHVCLIDRAKENTGRCSDFPAPNANNRYNLLLDVCRALWYLHSRTPPIIHGDLKPGNTLVEDLGKRWRAKLVDFGLSRILTDGAKPLGGTLRYMAPELKRRRGLRPNPSADVFSFGRVAYVVTNGRKPLEAYENEQIRNLLKMPAPPPLEWQENSRLVNLCKPLAEGCMSLDPSSRPGINEVHRAISSWPSPILGEDDDEMSELDPPSEETTTSMEWDEALHRLEREGHLKSIKPSGELAASTGRVPSPTCQEEELKQDPQQPHHNQQHHHRKQRRQHHPKHPPRSQTPIERDPEEEAVTADAGEARIASHLDATPQSTIKVLLIHMLSRCNVSSGQDSCCRIHAAARETSVCLEGLLKEQCRVMDDPTKEDWQCPSCKVLVPLGGSDSSCFCDVCGFERSEGLSERSQEGSPRSNEAVDAPPSTGVFTL